jgi:hypothetical protein
MRGGAGCRGWGSRAFVALALVVAGEASPGAVRAASSCGLPATSPVWIDYGDAVTPDVRDVFARPGVITSSGGGGMSAYYRAHGAATTYFELHLPVLVGQPSAPADPASIPAAARKLLSQAVASTGCATPQIALNELFGSNLVTPWSATNTVYRADVLALMQRLAAGGALPVLLVHGNYTVAGATADWWRQIAQSGEIVYEDYYDASHIFALGPLMGNRRMRLGIRGLVSDFAGIGIPPARLGVMLGFHSEVAPGIGGREGLEPREAWLQVVKWEALAARQVASETGLASIWSWGWASFSGADPDKAAAACVYLWTRDQSLCDGPGAGGPPFNASLTEGQIVLPTGVSCTFAGGQVRTSDVDALAALTHNRHSALSAVFARVVLQPGATVSAQQVLAVELQAIQRSFHGNRRGYLEALTRAHATLAVARGIIADELRRRAIASQLAASGSPQTTLEWTADREANAVNTTTCLHDDLPGAGGFPQTDAREVGVIPLPAKIPFLFADKTPPATPGTPTAIRSGTIVLLNWTANPEPDLAGYEVFRAPTSGGPYQQTGPFLDHPSFIDPSASTTAPSYYVIRAVDSSGNRSEPSAEISAVP